MFSAVLRVGAQLQGGWSDFHDDDDDGTEAAAPAITVDTGAATGLWV
jgi:hypothetical protein